MASSNSILNFNATKKKYTLIALSKIFNASKYLYVYLRLYKLMGLKVPSSEHGENSFKYKELADPTRVESVLEKKYNKNNAEIVDYLHTAYSDALLTSAAMYNVATAKEEIAQIAGTTGVLTLNAEDWVVDSQTHNKYGQYLLLHYDLLNTVVAPDVAATASSIAIVRNHLILGKLPKTVDDLRMHDGIAQFVVDLTGKFDASQLGLDDIVVLPCAGLNVGSFTKNPDAVAKFATTLLNGAMSSGVYIIDGESSACYTGAGMQLALVLLHKIGQKLPLCQSSQMYTVTQAYAAALLKKLNIISTTLIANALAIAKK